MKHAIFRRLLALVLALCALAPLCAPRFRRAGGLYRPDPYRHEAADGAGQQHV